MKDEIIDKIKKCLIAGYDINIISQEELNEYWNYITNLQKENKQLKEKIEKLKDYGEKVGERRNQLYEKIDKAIEYIKEHNCIATNKEYLPKEYEYCCSYELLSILGDKE